MSSVSSSSLRRCAEDVASGRGVGVEAAADTGDCCCAFWMRVLHGGAALLPEGTQVEVADSSTHAGHHHSVLPCGGVKVGSDCVPADLDAAGAGRPPTLQAPTLPLSVIAHASAPVHPSLARASRELARARASVWVC